MHLTESCENSTDTNQSASLLAYLMTRLICISYEHDSHIMLPSRDAHLQSALVVGKMKRAVSNPQVTFVFLASSCRICWVQLVGLLFTQITQTHLRPVHTNRVRPRENTPASVNGFEAPYQEETTNTRYKNDRPKRGKVMHFH